jgi:hypothetical protein
MIWETSNRLRKARERYGSGLIVSCKPNLIVGGLICDEDDD